MASFTSGLPVNSAGQVIAVVGNGDTAIAGVLPPNTVPIDANGRMILNGIGGGSGGGISGVTGTAPVSVANGTTAPVISMAAATDSVPGYLTAADHAAFNAKLSPGTITAGTYNNVTVGANGLVTGGSNVSYGAPAPAAITASRSVVAADNSGTLYSTSATAYTLTIPSGLPAGFGIAVVQSGTGAVSIAAGSGVTINSADNFTKTGGQYRVISLINTAANTYVLVGAGAA